MSKTNQVISVIEYKTNTIVNSKMNVIKFDYSVICSVTYMYFQASNLRMIIILERIC